jgi:hypothetical protein
MMAAGKLKQVFLELKAHSPFTLFGALTGIVLMYLFRNTSHQTLYRLFYVFHPTHVVLSAMVTASLFRLHEKTKGFITILLVGYIGSIGTATLSDSILPLFGEEILGAVIPTESAVHSHESATGLEQEHHQEHHQWHIGFIEEWYIVNPAALLGIFIAYFLPRSKVPHAFHILISTWASLAHIMMNTQGSLTIVLTIGIFIVLFIAVWLPCCFSDIVFPMLLIKTEGQNCVFCSGEHHEHKH